MLNGTPNEFTTFNGVPVPVKDQFLWYEFWGSERTFPHFAAGWAWAMGTPFTWVKQVPSHFGRTTQGVAMSWPGHITDVGGVRRQFHHIIDIVPTILEAAGIPEPTLVHGITQRPIEGVSMKYTWDKASATAKSRRTTQYFEMLGIRAIYHDGWVAATTPATLPSGSCVLRALRCGRGGDGARRPSAHRTDDVPGDPLRGADHAHHRPRPAWRGLIQVSQHPMIDVRRSMGFKPAATATTAAANEGSPRQRPVRGRRSRSSPAPWRRSCGAVPLAAFWASSAASPWGRGPRQRRGRARPAGRRQFGVVPDCSPPAGPVLTLNLPGSAPGRLDSGHPSNTPTGPRAGRGSRKQASCTPFDAHLASGTRR